MLASSRVLILWWLRWTENGRSGVTDSNRLARGSREVIGGNVKRGGSSRAARLAIRLVLIGVLLAGCSWQTTEVREAPTPAHGRPIEAHPGTAHPGTAHPGRPAAANRQPARRRKPAASQQSRLRGGGAYPNRTVRRQPACGHLVPLRLDEQAGLRFRIGRSKRLRRSWRANSSPGIYWTLNDSGNDPLMFAFDEQGRSRGTFSVDGADNFDWESMQLGPGRDGGFACTSATPVTMTACDGTRRSTACPSHSPCRPSRPTAARPKSRRPPRRSSFRSPGSLVTRGDDRAPTTGRSWYPKETAEQPASDSRCHSGGRQTARLEQVAD